MCILMSMLAPDYDMPRHWNCVLAVKNVPVNYAFRFSGPVTALTARRVRYGVGPDLICQPGPSPGIKAHSSPAAFPTTLSLPFSPWTLYLPARALGRCRFHLFPVSTPGPHRTDTTRPVEKMSQCHGWLSFARRLAALSRRPSDPYIDP
jgi:hypothetical protein